MNYLLDTNIALTYIRDTAQSRRLENDLQLLSGQHNLIVSVVSVGELKSIAKQNKWGQPKLQRMLDSLNDFLVADINVEDVIEKYAEIDAYSQGKLAGTSVPFSARNMGKNDLWIAATAALYNFELLTTDRDFDHLANAYLKLRVVDLRRYK